MISWLFLKIQAQKIDSSMLHLKDVENELKQKFYNFTNISNIPIRIKERRKWVFEYLSVANDIVSMVVVVVVVTLVPIGFEPAVL